MVAPCLLVSTLQLCSVPLTVMPTPLERIKLFWSKPSCQDAGAIFYSFLVMGPFRFSARPCFVPNSRPPLIISTGWRWKIGPKVQKMTKKDFVRFKNLQKKKKLWTKRETFLFTEKKDWSQLNCFHRKKISPRNWKESKNLIWNSLIFSCYWFVLTIVAWVAFEVMILEVIKKLRNESRNGIFTVSEQTWTNKKLLSM